MCYMKHELLIYVNLFINMLQFRGEKKTNYTREFTTQLICKNKIRFTFINTADTNSTSQKQKELHRRHLNFELLGTKKLNNVKAQI